MRYTKTFQDKFPFLIWAIKPYSVGEQQNDVNLQIYKLASTFSSTINKLASTISAGV